jgi:hypothetical protein
MEKYKKRYNLILFTKRRWGTVYYAAQRASVVKAACASLPGEILNADLDIDMCDKLKALVTDPAYWKGVAAFEVLFKTISSCLTYLEGDEATFSAVYACFVAIKYHLKTLDYTVKEGLSLDDDAIERMTVLTHHRLANIYTEAHALAFATDPMFTDMRIRIAQNLVKSFLKSFCNSGRLPLIIKQRLLWLDLPMAMMTFDERCSVSLLLTLQGAKMIHTRQSLEMTGTPRPLMTSRTR